MIIIENFNLIYYGSAKVGVGSKFSPPANACKSEGAVLHLSMSCTAYNIVQKRLWSCYSLANVFVISNWKRRR